MDVSEVTAIVVGVGGVGVALLAYFKPKPGDEERLEMEREKAGVALAQANLNIAQGTVVFVKETLQEQVDRVLADQTALRKDWDRYRLDAEDVRAQLSAELRGEKAENEHLRRENVRLEAQVAENQQLKARIEDLEAEVARLKEAQQGG